MREWVRKNRMKNALTSPTTRPIPRQARNAAPSGHPSRALRIASSMAENVRTAATERSKSPAVSGMMRARVRTRSTACDPKMMEEKVGQVRNEGGATWENPRISSALAMRSA